ncbi:restriction endonuclease [Xylophilus ampelinus]|uniref:Metal-independent restriction enzyme BfiI DNA binding domain-containing protein n=1 Tax=Xylophilus ampelinus TaxID=54067 RepID=A0A318SDI2_9BURK|nr:restriction endonuclease [Xylophilus ampelinus]MCS4511890.1 hypothetical protein [Xylophilus ampelinus]PYE72999.1 hypothetical protein DFQ15_1451 [Xylophilus ampelinus]
MNELTLHPNVYATGQSKGLVNILERVWVREHTPGDGTMFVVSGFGNYNGGVRFFETFRAHKARGGNIVAVFAGSASSRLTSKQVVREMLDCGAYVHVVNRKRLLHAKCYGAQSSRGDALVVTSGNFTGPGMSQNVEMSVLLDQASTAAMNFSWGSLVDSMLAQNWALHQPTLADLTAPAWQLLYDEQATDVVLDDTGEVTMLLRLSHSDTARIKAARNTTAAKGTQYFWLSKDCYDFFPPLTIRNERGHKATYSCLVTMNYIELGRVDNQCRVTFEAENNLDFRLGTGPLRYSGLADEGDLAAISRVGEKNYEMRLYPQGSAGYRALMPFAVNFIGHQGKQYGFMPNSEFNAVAGVRVGVQSRRHLERLTKRCQ